MQAITFAIAVLGAVLGLINTWHGLDKSRVKLKVLPAYVIQIGGLNQFFEFSIEVTNLSTFPVTIREVGFLFHGSKKRGFIEMRTLDGSSLPRRLEPRSSFTLYSRLPNAENGKIRCAYAATQCGVMKRGNSPALKQIAEGKGI
jgi:hypothetical protein